MFHKEQSIHGRKKAVDVPVKKSDRRKLLDRAKRYFDALASRCKLNDDDIKALDAGLDAAFIQGNLSSRSIPMEGGKAWNMILYLKTPTKSDDSDGSTHPWPYSTSSQFVWMALEEKNKVVRETPTVSLWAVLSSIVPSLLNEETAVWVPSAVSKFVCRGADLMRAGMRTLPEGVEMVPIVAQGNPQPFAVGQVQKPIEPIGVGTKGVGVLIWNVYGDDLWRFSNTKQQCTGEKYFNTVGGQSFDNGSYGNVGFQHGKWVLPVIDTPEEDSSSSEGATDSIPGPVNDSITEVEQCSLVEKSKDFCRNESNVVGEIHPLTEADSISQAGNNKSDELTPDQVLHQSVLRALLSLRNKDFPMPTGTFYAQHVIISRPEGTTIDLKSTIYKKFGQYLKVQVERDLLQAGPDKSNPKNTDPMALLTGYNKKHDDLKNMPKPASASSTAIDSQGSKTVMVSLYIVPHNVASLMKLNEDAVKAENASSEDRRGTGMLTVTEARTILEDYVTREELIPPGRPDQVLLDGPLTQAVYRKQSDTPEKLHRRDLVKQFIDKLSPAYALVEMPGSRIIKLAKGPPPPIEIEVSMRQSRKFVTRLRGLEDYRIDPTYFSKDVAKRLACSASIETTASSGRPALRKNYVELIFQGNIVNELEALLVDESLSSHGGIKGSEYSVPKQVLTIRLKKGVPGRKKGGGSKR